MPLYTLRIQFEKLESAGETQKYVQRKEGISRKYGWRQQIFESAVTCLPPGLEAVKVCTYTFLGHIFCIKERENKRIQVLEAGDYNRDEFIQVLLCKMWLCTFVLCIISRRIEVCRLFMSQTEFLITRVQNYRYKH